MRRIAWFALRFVALTVPLTWLWVSGGRELYASGFSVAAGALYELVGLEGVQAAWRERYINVVPYVALVLLTPGLGWRRRAAGLGLGLAAIFCAQVIVNGIAQAGQPRVVDLPIELAVLSDALPFLLWAILARDFVAELGHGVAGTPAAERADP